MTAPTGRRRRHQHVDQFACDRQESGETGVSENCPTTKWMAPVDSEERDGAAWIQAVEGPHRIEEPARPRDPWVELGLRRRRRWRQEECASHAEIGRASCRE